MNMKNQKIELVDINLLRVSENLRGEVTPASVQDIAESLPKVGMIHAILARKCDMQVEDGARRLLAAKLAGWTQVPVLFVDELESDSHAVQRQIIANTQREALPPTVVAKGIFELMESAKCPAREAAALVGLSTNAGKLTRMMRLPAEQLALIDDGKIPPSSGYLLSQVEDPAKQAELASQIVEKKLTRDGLQRIIQAMKSSNPVKTTKAIRKSTIVMDGGRSVTIAAPGLNLAAMISCLEALLKRAKQERKRGIELETFVKMLLDQSQKVAEQ